MKLDFATLCIEEKTIPQIKKPSAISSFPGLEPYGLEPPLLVINKSSGMQEEPGWHGCQGAAGCGSRSSRSSCRCLEFG